MKRVVKTTIVTLPRKGKVLTIKVTTKDFPGRLPDDDFTDAEVIDEQTLQ